MKQFLFLIALTISMSANAQKSEVIDKLKEYHFSDEFLTTNLKDADAQHYFDVKITTINSSETTVEDAKFDPSKNIGERWILLSVNGNSPSKKDLKKFDKAHNTKIDDINGSIDDNSWGIEKDDSDFLVINFKYDKSSLPKKYDYLGDCKGLAFFNKKTKRLEKAEFINEQPLKIKMFKVTKLDMVVTYTYNSEEQSYLIEKENLAMEVKLLGQVISIQEINEFSNYRK